MLVRILRPQALVSLLLVLVLVVVASGCSEHLYLQSRPSGAKLWIDGVEVGITPFDYKSRSPQPLVYRMEKAGYPPVEGEVTTATAGGRVTGAIFTLGILAIVRPMRYFVPYEVDAYLGPDQPPTVLMSLYHVASASVLKGECDTAGGKCWIERGGRQCPGEYVQESTGSRYKGASVSTVASAHHSAVIGNVGASEVTLNKTEGAAVFRCSGWMAECAFTAASGDSEGHGECKDSAGKRYKLMIRPKPEVVSPD